MRILTPLILASLLIIPFGCDDSPAEREHKVDEAADSTGKVINDVADKTPRVKVDVDVTTQPAATQSTKTTTVTKTTTATRPASP